METDTIGGSNEQGNGAVSRSENSSNNHEKAPNAATQNQQPLANLLPNGHFGQPAALQQQYPNLLPHQNMLPTAPGPSSTTPAALGSAGLLLPGLLLPGTNNNSESNNNASNGIIPPNNNVASLLASSAGQPLMAWTQALQGMGLFAAASSPQQQQALLQQQILAMGLQGMMPPTVLNSTGTTTTAPALSQFQSISATEQTPIAPNPSTLPLKRSADSLTEPDSKRVAPSVVSSYDGASADIGPPIKMSDSELAKLSPAQKRRYERNLREQQRSYKISQQIKELRDVLKEGNIPFKPNKFSILVSVTNYIKELQARAIMLGADHQRLLNTIKETTERVASGQIPSSEDSSSEDNKDVTSSSLSSASDHGIDALMVQGIDFKSVFRHCPYASGVCSLDGRILACNPAFERAMGCQEGEMEQQSLFLYIRNHQEIFEAMADLLKRSTAATETMVDRSRDSGLLYWCGNIVGSNQVAFSLSISLINVDNGNPKFFGFSAATVG